MKDRKTRRLPWGWRMTEYLTVVDGVSAGAITTGLGGKLVLSVELGGKAAVTVEIKKA